MRSFGDNAVLGFGCSRRLARPKVSDRSRRTRRDRRVGHRGQFRFPRTTHAATEDGRGLEMIEAKALTKHYGEKVAVDQLSFTVRPGVVTGFLGPNGSGKSTTMRMIMGLDAPTTGDVTVKGLHYRDLPWPLHEVGALLEAKAIHPGRSARAHLQMLAESSHIPRSRIDEVLDLVGLTAVAGQRAGKFSLGMGRRH